MQSYTKLLLADSRCVARLLVLLWLPVVCVLSMPMVMYLLTLSLPPDENSIGLGHGGIKFLGYAIGLILYCIKSLVLPKPAAAACAI